MERYCKRQFEAGSLSRDQFIDWLAEDIMTAKAKCDAAERMTVRKAWRKAKNDMTMQLRKFYSGRYKKRSTIDKHVAEELTEWTEKNRWRYKFYGMGSLKFSISPWQNGGCFYIHIDRDMIEYIGKMWDMHLDNKYLCGCTGWFIVVDGYSQYLELILPNELEAQWKEDERKLGEAIGRFYAGSNYLGD